MMCKRNAIRIMQTSTTTHQVTRRLGNCGHFTNLRTAFQTPAAPPTAWAELKDYMVTNRHICNGRASFNDFSGSFVTHNHRYRTRPGPVHD
jgi:hypothetical protein